jgi:hypothetical protein
MEMIRVWYRSNLSKQGSIAWIIAQLSHFYSIKRTGNKIYPCSNHADEKCLLGVVTAQQGMVLFNPLFRFAQKHRQSVLQDTNPIANVFDDIRTM